MSNPGIDLWTITNPATDVIFGTVQANGLTEAAALADAGAAQWFGGTAPGPHEQLSAHPVFTLADRQWRELAPTGPGSQGQCGGDVQVTEAFSRRFAMVRRDGTWAVITYAWYGINETVPEVDADTEPEVVEQQIEFLIVEDPHDLDDVLWYDDDYCKEYDPDPSEDGVRKHAAAFTAGDIDWDGEAFSS